VTGATIPAGAGVTNIGDRSLAQGVGEPNWTGAGE